MNPGRGAESNPPPRFEKLSFETDWDAYQMEDEGEEKPRVRTQFFRDGSQSIIASNDSPDLPFDYSINPYRGCEHGCAYCYARPTHEFLGWSAGLDFESRILVKMEAPALLRQELDHPSWKSSLVSMSGVTDPYQPVEKKLQLTRGCLEVLNDFRNPAAIVTKNSLVTRDLDLLRAMQGWNGVVVFLSLTTLNDDLRRKMEPRTSSVRMRLNAISELRQAGIAVGFLMAPVIPGLTDHEIPSVVKAASEAGAEFGFYTVLRLPYGVNSLFFEWVGRHVPNQEARIRQRISDLRGGKMNDSNFGDRFRGTGPAAEQMSRLFRIACNHHRVQVKAPQVDRTQFRRPGGHQMEFQDLI
ncbi:MAG: PA0069 family radical SAM protein [Verrucomicrobia bacterium]|nr:PA0069 family radical SAM protein [Verrucomicrobiota bacterium]